MPITVSCPACGSRFSLSDDLYRRRVAGSLVKVKCRHCSAEIAVDATEPSSTHSQEAARKQHSPPRRSKSVTKRGLGLPPATSTLATSSPLPDDAPRPTLPLNATITPLPDAPASKPAPASLATDSIWGDDEETIAINLKTKAPVRPAFAQSSAEETEELEQIEAEEITFSESPVSDGPISENPVSSSGTPTLDALTVEAGGANVPHGRSAPDEFLVQFGGGGDGQVGAPTIDVTSFASEITPTNLAVASVAAEERELEARRVRSNTVPLFDMNGVLPTPSKEESPSKVSQPRASSKQVPVESAAATPARERKFVVPPKAAVAPTPVATAPVTTTPVTTTPAVRRKARASRAPLWVGLVAAAGVVGAGLGYRERSQGSPSSAVAQVGVGEPAPTHVVNTQAALPAEAVNTDTAQKPSSALPEATSAAIAAGSAPISSGQNLTVATPRSVAPSGGATIKTNPRTSGNISEPPSKTEPPADKPLTSGKTIEAHNAPPPAAPDTEFNRDAARNALAGAAAQASSCRKEGDPSGTANLTITFAPSGRVTSAQIQGPPFSGTATGGCIATTMRRASVPAFSGDYVTVSKTIVIQ